MTDRPKMDPGARLLHTQIKAAVAAMDAAEAKVTTATAEFESKSKAVGMLLLDAKKLHPKKKNFEAFLEKVNGLKLTRAYECIAIAQGRTTDQEVRAATRDRVRKHRASSKARPEPEAESVTVTDGQLSAEDAADSGAEAPDTATVRSVMYLRVFKRVCRKYLPKLTDADLETAREYVAGDAWKPRPRAVSEAEETETALPEAEAAE